MVSYAPLWKTMDEKKISTYKLIKDYGISSKTLYNLKHNRGITTDTLEKLCISLQCTPNQVIEFVDID